QLALLTAGEGAGPTGRVRLLDESEGLEDRVVEVGCHLGPLLGPDALPSLPAEVAQEAHDQRAEQDRDADAGGDDGEAELASPGQGAARCEQAAETRHHEKPAPGRAED